MTAAAAGFLNVESGGERIPGGGVIGVAVVGVASVGVARPSCEDGGVRAGDSAACIRTRRALASALGWSTDKIREGDDDADPLSSDVDG